jgi:hypothetical protein
MNLISLILVLAVVGVALYVLETLVPMDQRIKKVIVAIVLIAVLFYLLQSFGVIGETVRIR